MIAKTWEGDMRWLTAFIAGAVAFMATGIGSPASAECKIAKGATIPIRMIYDRVIADVEINGQKVIALIDTGASHTMLLRSKAEALGLKMQALDASLGTFVGIGGFANASLTKINSFKIGGSEAKN